MSDILQTTASVADLDNVTGYFDTLADFKASTKVYTRVHIRGYYSADDNAFGSNDHFLLPDDGTTYTDNYGVTFQTASGRWYRLGYSGELLPSYFGLINMTGSTLKLAQIAMWLDDNLQYGYGKAQSYIRGLGYGYVEGSNKDSSQHKITGTAYYFSTSGDDNNDGLSPETPFKTYDKFLYIKKNKLNTDNGDGVLFKRGDVWSADTEDFTDPSNNYFSRIQGSASKPHIISCYGEGELPLFDAMKDQTSTLNGTWTDSSGEYAGTWKTANANFTVNKIINLTVNGIYIPSLTQISDFSLVTGTGTEADNDYFFHDDNGDLYINFDPSTIASIRFSEREKFIVLQTASYNFEISHLNIKDFSFKNFSMDENYVGNHDYSIHDCVVGEGSYYGILASGTDFSIYNNLVDSKLQPSYRFTTAEHTYSSVPFEAIRITPQTGNVNFNVSSNTVTGFMHGAIIVSTIIDLSNPTIINGNAIKNLIINDIEVETYGNRLAISGTAEDFIMEDNILVTATQSQFAGSSNIKGNLFYKCVDDAGHYQKSGSAIVTNIQTDTSNMNILDNVAWKCDGTGIQLVEYTDKVIDSVTVKNNIIYDCAKNGGRNIYDKVYGSQVMVRLIDGSKLTNTLCSENMIYSTITNDVVFDGTDVERGNDATKFITVAEAEATTFPEGTVFEKNVQIDPSVFIK